MNTPLTTLDQDLGPIDPNWTITELVAWLSEDSRQHDPALQRPLALIDAALTGEPWARTPSTIVLIRSLAVAARSHGSSAIADLLLPSPPLSLVA